MYLATLSLRCAPSPLTLALCLSLYYFLFKIGSQLWPRHVSVIIGLYSCSFDASAVTFAVYQVRYFPLIHILLSKTKILCFK